MKISIGIPCFKQAEYLVGAVDSALGQTYEDIEIIIVNDGSPDKTGEIAAKYQLAHPFKVKVIHQVNKGLASARNSAIMNMTGEYFLPLDADDILAQNCVEEIVKKAEETNADIIGPSMTTFGQAVETVIVMENPTLTDFLVGNRLGYFSAIRKSCLLECGGYSPKMDVLGGYEDLHLWFDLLTRGKKIATIQTPLVLYRTKSQSMWKDAMKNHDKLMKQIYNDFPQVLPTEVKA